jgi:hypothetical protein
VTGAWSPSGDARYRTKSGKQENPLNRQCPLADPLAAASQKIRRKSGGRKASDYDAILTPGCARRVAIFLPRVASFFLRAALRDRGRHAEEAKGSDRPFRVGNA